MALDLRSSELEHAFIKERINNVEKHFNDICSRISAYIRKIAGVRDSGDDVAKAIYQFSSKEVLNQSLRISLCQLSDLFSAVQDYRDAQIHRLEAKVIFELSNYSPVCKHAKEELKKNFEARARELNKKNQLQKILGKKPINWQKINQAENEVSQAQGEATRATNELSKQVELFEKQKLEDIKRVFLEFIKIEMIFHAKALELYTKAYSSISGIRTDDDMKEFRSHFGAYSCTSSSLVHKAFTQASSEEKPPVEPNMDVNTSAKILAESTPVPTPAPQAIQSLFLAASPFYLNASNSASSLNTTAESGSGDQ